MSDPIADMFTCIRNASQALRPDLKVPHSQLKEKIARLLQREGFLAEVTVEDAPLKNLRLKLKYQGRKGVIDHLKRISKPGLRRYVRATDIPRVLGGMGTVILTTPRGVLTGVEARQLNVGGEVVCYVW